MQTEILVSINVVLLLLLIFQYRYFSKRLNTQKNVHMPEKKASARVSYLEPTLLKDSQIESVANDESEMRDASDLVVSDDQQEALLSTHDTADESCDFRVDSREPIEITVSDTPMTDSHQQGDEDMVDSSASQFVSLYIEAAPDKPYMGYELLQAILSSGMRYGEHSLFHFYVDSMAKDKVMFSLASAIEPCTFDLPRMGSFSTKALTIFMDASCCDDALKVFEKMLHTAGQLCDDLGGQVLNADKQRLTKECVREICMRIRSAEQSKHNLDLFEEVDVYA